MFKNTSPITTPMAKKITIIRIRRTPDPNINRELQWIGNSLGLFNLRDKDSSCFRIFITLIKSAKQNNSLSSDAIAQRLTLSRGTVVHHLNKLMDSGLVLREREGYILRESNLGQLIADMQSDANAMFDELSKVALDIDEKLG